MWTIGDSYEHGSEPSGCIKFGKFLTSLETVSYAAGPRSMELLRL